MKTIEIFAEAVKFASEASDIPDVTAPPPTTMQQVKNIAESVRRTLNALSVVSASQRTTSRIRNKSATIRRRAMFDKKKRMHDMCNPFRCGVVFVNHQSSTLGTKAILTPSTAPRRLIVSILTL